MFKFAQLKSALPSHTFNKQNQSARGRSLNPAPIDSSALGYLAVLYVRGGGRNIWRHYRLKLSVHFIFDQLCTFHSFPLHSSVLKPYFYLYQNQPNTCTVTLKKITKKLCMLLLQFYLKFFDNRYIIQKIFNISSDVSNYIA